MSGVNKVILVGRVGKDPEIRNAGESKVANFSIATSETWKDKQTGEKKEQTEWHSIVIWRKLAEVVEQYVKKGDMVYIEGKLKTRSWEKDGITRYTTEVVGDNMTMLGGNQAISQPSNTQSPNNQEGNSGSNITGESTGDLPF